MSVVEKNRHAGFSLVELVTVIVLLGILSVVALGRFGDQDQFAARGYFNDVVNAVRFAQKLAISSGCDARVAITLVGSITRYQLQQSSSCIADDFTVTVKNPANRSLDYVNDLPSGYSLTVGNILFDARGRREGTTSDFVLNSGTLSYSFRVHAETGLVEVI